MSFRQIQEILEPDLVRLDQAISSHCHSEIALINDVMGHIFKQSGKRLRPLILMLTARAFSYSGVKHIQLAAMLEYIHTATLLHDDVVDESSLRRGQVTANIAFGNEAPILVGDFLYARAFKLLVEVKEPEALHALVNATIALAEAEAMQLEQRFNWQLSEEQYRSIIQGKTGQLFALATELGGILAHVPASTRENLKTFGMHLGTAFQLADDALDYSASAEEMGKNPGDDIARGNLTLPLIYTLRVAGESDARFLREQLDTKDSLPIQQICPILDKYEAVAYTLKQAKAEAYKAKSTLAEITIDMEAERRALNFLVDFAVNRTY